eukprot:11489327-Alexandrium_andersonii.AAC.1
MFTDGAPRVGCFNKKSYPSQETVDRQTPCVLDIISFFTSRPLPSEDTPGTFDPRGLTISDRLDW